MKLVLDVAADTKAKIKAHAGRLITQHYPEWKQRNMLARAIELQHIRGLRALTTEEEIEEQNLLIHWGNIAELRNHSDALEAQVDAGQTVNYDSGWPEIL